MLNEKKPSSTLARASGSIATQRALRKIIPIAIGIIVALLLIAYVCSVLFNRYGSFTVSVTEVNNQNYSLALSESDTFTQQTSRLNSKAVKSITNISGTTLPVSLNDEGGEHNGENYVAYTFFLKNTGTTTCSYKYDLIVTSATLGIENAARVRLYYNKDYYKSATDVITTDGSYTDFAKAKTGGNGDPEIDSDEDGNPTRVMTNFASNATVTQSIVKDFAPGDIAKITVVIWLEGDDPDCTDDILGGQLKLDMLFNVVEATEQN